MIEKRIVNWKSRTVLFLISQCVTLFGSTLVQMAIVWYVTLNTSSGVWVAAFSICSYLPQFLMSFIGGVWADRYSRKRLIIGADISIAAVTFIMMLAMPFIREEKFLLGGLLVMSIIRSVGAGIQTPAVNAVIPQLVPESQLMRFNGINATMQSLVQFAAPAAAGLLLSLSTLQSTLIIDILTAVFGVGILSCVLIPKQRSIEKSASVIKDMRMGIHFAFSDKLIRKLLIVYGLFTFLCVPAGFLAGLLVNRVYGNTYWYLTAVELIGFFGMIMGGLLMSLWRGFKSRINTLVFGLFIFGIMAVGIQDKVMQTKNEDEISNGDIGIVRKIGKMNGKKYMEVDFGEERVMRYQEGESWNLVHAYAITAHKGQGSEYPVVIIPVLSCFRRHTLKRNLYYTAITRAKRRVILVGSKQAFSQAIRAGRSKKRNTLLSYRLKKAFAEFLDKNEAA